MSFPTMDEIPGRYVAAFGFFADLIRAFPGELVASLALRDGVRYETVTLKSRDNSFKIEWNMLGTFFAFNGEENREMWEYVAHNGRSAAVKFLRENGIRHRDGAESLNAFDYALRFVQSASGEHFELQRITTTEEELQITLNSYQSGTHVFNSEITNQTRGNLAMKNPWKDFDFEDASKTRNYVHPIDRDLVAKLQFSAKDESKTLLTHMLPEPWVGSLEAPVIVLQGNPGANEEEAKVSWQPSPAQREAAIATLREERMQYPLYWLDPKLAETDGAKWSGRTLRNLIEDAGAEVLANRLLLIEFYAYHSRSFDNRVKGLPTQAFTNELVNNAVRDGKLIVMVRNRKAWEEQVPALIRYAETGNVLTTSSVQNASLSPGNLKDGYEKLLRAILS